MYLHYFGISHFLHGILGVVLGVKGMHKTGSKCGKAGMITGIVGLSIFGFIYISLMIILFLAGI